MPEYIATSIERLEEDIEMLKKLDSSYWNKSLGTSHLKSFARTIQNDADSLAFNLKNF